MSEERFKGLSEVKLIALTSAALLVGQSREEIAEALEKFCRKCFQQGLEEGHASRDPELAAEREKVEKLRALVTELQIKHSKGFYTPMHEMDRQRLMAELSAEREASKKLVEALHHCRNRPHEHNPPPDFIITRCEVIDEALKFYATPGHSPEGKTLSQKSDKEKA